MAAKLRLEDGVLLCSFADPDGGGAAPELHLHLAGKQVAKTVAVSAGPGMWEASFPLPVAAQRDGAAVLDVHLAAGGGHLGRYTIFNGTPPTDDLASSLALLGSELQALKRAFMEEASVPKLTAVERPLLIAEAVEQALTALDARGSGDPGGQT